MCHPDQSRQPRIVRLLATALAISTTFACAARAQTQAPAPAGAPPATAPAQTLLKGPELEALLAPIALYPDSLLTQMLMASTYPLEIVQADRFAKANKNLKGADLTAQLEKQTWDASVKSLVNFPDVLSMMSEKLDLTIKIGDAFIAQQVDVMNTIQVLRNKAQAQGNLKTNEQQKIVVEAAPPPDTTVIVQQPAPTQIIKIEPTQPEVIYVPSYNPTVVYGGWAYPSYPPAPYYPPGYVASNMMSFGLGVACGAAWGYAWGNCNWGGGDVDIDVDRNTNINNNIDRSKYKNEIQNRQTNRQGGDRVANRAGQGAAGRGQGNWQHNPQHRGGVPYRDQKTSQRFGDQTGRANQARDQYRGRTEGGNFGSGAGGNRSNFSPSAQPRNNTGSFNQGQRPSAGTSDRAGGGNRPSSFEGMDRGGASAKAASQRGQSSRSSASSGSRSGGSRSSASPSRSGGGSRSSGGGSRGGGGGGRGGGGGGGRGRSDVEIKDNFLAVDPAVTLQKVMELSITTWNYKDEPQARHLGPMAQDFYHTFGIGTDDKTITFLDEGGVALSAIQGLNQRIDQKDAKIQSLEKEVAELKAKLEELSAKFSAAAESKD